MRTLLLCLGFAAILFARGAPGAKDEMTKPRQPVLVELFTSEGCSSCPPADALLEKLDYDQPVADAQIIVLSEHVDYWNHLGWKDPYSSAAFSARQVAYARRFGLDGPYTPQMVVDGTAEFNGSDARRAVEAIRQSVAAGAKTAIRIKLDAAGDGAAIEAGPLPAGTAHQANVYLAYARETGTSDVLRGENSGRRLRHVSIVTEIQQIGTVSPNAAFSRQVRLHAIDGSAGFRLVAFVQEPGSGRVLGSTLFTISKGVK